MSQQDSISYNQTSGLNSYPKVSYKIKMNNNSSDNYLSDFEKKILRLYSSNDLNKKEKDSVIKPNLRIENISQDISKNSFEDYRLNLDEKPTIIHKNHGKTIAYIQEFVVRYLKPLTPPPPGDIIIKKEPNSQTKPAPPIIIRQIPKKSVTPEPLIIREAPPPVPSIVGEKKIIIKSRNLPPPPRKVIIERLPKLPAKPSSVLIERWLPYKPVKQRVIYQKPDKQDPIIEKPKNVIIQWEAPNVQIERKFTHLGIIKADPLEYIKKYTSSLSQNISQPLLKKPPLPPKNNVLSSSLNKKNEKSIHTLINDRYTKLKKLIR